MKLPKPFYRLPLRFDAARLKAEVAALPEAAWQRHPGNYQGNSAARLITVGGEENDAVAGAMRPTAHLEQLPYVRQVLAGFGVVWGRSRLMRLAPHSEVPEHADINYHWFNRVRVHIPVVTYPAVRFHCDGQSVHMAEGECWVFDNWRLHRVENPTEHERIHLVADTTGSSAFWDLVLKSQAANFERVEGPAPAQCPYDPRAPATPVTERYNAAPVMPPAEVEALAQDLLAEIDAGPAGSTALPAWQSLVANFCREWRSLWSLYGDTAEGHPAYRRLCAIAGGELAAIRPPLVMKTNRMSALEVFNARILQYAVHTPGQRSGADREYESRPQGAASARAVVKFDRPVFIVSAPRSGSTLLFETLACSESLVSLGDESHGVIEKHPALRPGAPGVESNRLDAAAASEDVAAAIRDQFAAQMKNHRGEAPAPDATVRFLEKTPKNALRIPFFNALFPDARFVFLWRDPRENISSIMEAWRSGGWVTYPGLPGWDGPWSMLLPPGWQSLHGKPLEEIAAYQWDRTNRQILDDLAALDRSRWMALEYAAFLADPKRAIERVCAFADIPFDAALAQRVDSPLPLSRYTHTRPDREKWRRNERALERVAGTTAATLERLKKL